MVEIVPGPYADDTHALEELYAILSKVKLRRRHGRYRSELSPEGYAIVAALRVLTYNAHAREAHKQGIEVQA